MYEYEYFDGCDYTTFDLIETDCDRKKITIAVTNIGKISVLTYDLYDGSGLYENDDEIYFEYGPQFKKIYLENFTFQEEK